MKNISVRVIFMENSTVQLCCFFLGNLDSELLFSEPVLVSLQVFIQGICNVCTNFLDSWFHIEPIKI